MALHARKQIARTTTALAALLLLWSSADAACDANYAGNCRSSPGYGNYGNDGSLSHDRRSLAWSDHDAGRSLLQERRRETFRPNTYGDSLFRDPSRPVQPTHRALLRD